jgi:hypothetical protein
VDNNKNGVIMESNSFNFILSEIIERLYPRKSQITARVILNAHFSQTADRSRRMTLESLGKVDGLNKTVSRQRAEQILNRFYNLDLPKEIERLKRGLEYNDDITISNRKDIANLYKTVETIIKEISTFEFPIFSERIQARLKRLELIDDAIYIPIIIELAKSLNLDMNFYIHDYNGHGIILDYDKDIKNYTEDIVLYAGKIATHLGGVFPIDALIDPTWNESSPKSLSLINGEIKRKYVLDLLGAIDEVIFLQDASFFAFKGRDERVSSMLLPIFSVYKSQIDTEVLFSAIITGLTHRFMTKTKTPKRDYELQVIRSSALALDEYCIRTLLLDSRGGNFRVPGKNLIDQIEAYEPGDLYKAQMKVVEELRGYGSPIPSMEFGKICREKLNLKESSNVSLFTYPTLYYKEGEGRRRDFYKTLDGNYTNSIKSSVSVNNRGKHQEIEKLISRINELQSKLNKVKNDDLPYGQLRLEQGLIRKYLLASSDNVDVNHQMQSGKCQICNRYFPSNLLVAAHVKKRSLCSDFEKADVKNIAMLQCASCDKKFEFGYIYITDEGVIKINDNMQVTDDLFTEIIKLDGNNCEYFDKSEARLAYIRFHRNLALNN